MCGKQRLVGVEFDKVSMDDHTASVVGLRPVFTLVFCASLDDGGLKGRFFAERHCEMPLMKSCAKVSLTAL